MKIKVTVSLHGSPANMEFLEKKESKCKWLSRNIKVGMIANKKK